MDTVASASGSAIDAMMPVSAKSSGPSHFRIRQPPSRFTEGGTNESRHTIDNSSDVRITDQNVPCDAHRGSASLAASRQTEYVSGWIDKVRSARGITKSYHDLFTNRRYSFHG